LPTGERRAFGQWLVRDVTADAIDRFKAVRTAVTVITEKDARGIDRKLRVGGVIATNRNLSFLRAAFNWGLKKRVLDFLAESPFRYKGQVAVSLHPESEPTRTEITKADLLAFVVHLRERGVKPVSCNTWLRATNAFCRWLHEQGEAPMLVKLKPQRLETNCLRRPSSCSATTHPVFIQASSGSKVPASSGRFLPVPLTWFPGPTPLGGNRNQGPKPRGHVRDRHRHSHRNIRRMGSRRSTEIARGNEPLSGVSRSSGEPITQDANRFGAVSNTPVGGSPMIRTRIACLLLLAVFAAPVSAADVTGNWKLNINLNGVPELLCTVTQKDQLLEGTCKTGNEPGVDLNDGRVNGDQVSWSWKVTTPDANTWTYLFTGTLDANGSIIKGVAKFSVGSGSKQNEVNFTATKQ
jgi:hypothetical protein